VFVNQDTMMAHVWPVSLKHLLITWNNSP